MTKYILVNATSPTEGGSLVILESFICHISRNSSFNYIVFTTVNQFSFKLPINVQLINPNAKSWLRRIYWEFRGMKKWCNKNRITPALLISLQSNGVNFKGNIPQIIYYHNPVNIANYAWSFWSSSQRVLWLKAKFFSLLMRKYTTKRTNFIVQLNTTKDALLNTFNFIDKDKVQVFYPTIPLDMLDILNPSLREAKQVSILNEPTHDEPISKMKHSLLAEFVIFYPASKLPYKNHLEIVEAINYLQQRKFNLSKFRIIFTVTKSDVPLINRKINQYGIGRYFEFIGYITHKEVLKIYSYTNLVVFPSCLETYGLPLVEGAAMGLPVIAANKAYAREVLRNYTGATFINIGDVSAWGLAIWNISQNYCRYQPLDSQSFYPSWSECITFAENQANVMNTIKYS